MQFLVSNSELAFVLEQLVSVQGLVAHHCTVIHNYCVCSFVYGLCSTQGITHSCWQRGEQPGRGRGAGAVSRYSEALLTRFNSSCLLPLNLLAMISCYVHLMRSPIPRLVTISSSTTTRFHTTTRNLTPCTGWSRV